MSNNTTLQQELDDYLKAAEQGDAEAQYCLGDLYDLNYGRELDGIAYIGGTYDDVWDDETSGAEWYEKAAVQGHTEAQFRLGRCYYYGWDVEQDYAQAVQWYKKAAELGHAKSQAYLGVCYYKGKGVEQDYAQAVDCFCKAEKENFMVALRYLGLCYYYGNGVEQNYAKAVEYFFLSADNDYDYHCSILDGDYDELSLAIAQYHLALCYQNGYGVEQDEAKAKELLDLVAEYRTIELNEDGTPCIY
jgi:TPR repeat protein